jgi:valyl-tRNA synthetase
MGKSKYNFFDIQDSIREKWQTEETYKFGKAGREVFSIDTPPPTISGNLHIGHIFSYLHTDAAARFKRMSGYDVFYPFGFDNNGHPTEKYVEKVEKILAHQMPRKEFRDRCISVIEQAKIKFYDLFNKIGLSVDWNFCYDTISDDVQIISQKSFIELYKKGYIYRKSEPALYCTASRTTVSQADLEDIEKETVFSTIAFKVSDTNEDLLIATTRPELLASCVAIFVNPNDSRYKNLEGKFATTPIYNSKVPILFDENAEIEKGTGAVMCCTFGDSMDVYWFKKHKLNYIQSIGFDGKMTEKTNFLSGMNISQAREKILEKLKEEGFIKSQEKVTHRVQIYERSKKEIEYIVLNQWFVSILSYKDNFLEQIEKIEWIPDHMKQRCINWIEGLKWDWCISRQRSFGIPFPVWYDKSGKVILADESQLPVDPTENKPININEDIIPDADVMDTWNTSSITPYICYNMYKRQFGKNESFFPISVRPQAHDIIRTWAFDTIVKSWMHNEKIPWKTILISGHVLTNDKQKISKSKGNNPLDPKNLLSNYPADVVRYWALSSKLGIDAPFSEDQLKLGNKLLVKLWNAAVFVKQNGTTGKDIVQPRQDLNIWIIDEFNKLHRTYIKYFEKNEFSMALLNLESFFKSIFCDNYLEISKAQFMDQEKKYDTNQVDETRSILSSIFEKALHLFAPFFIHTTEYIYQDIYNKNASKFESLHRENILNLNYKFDISKEFNFESFLNVLFEIRKMKTDNNLSLRTMINEIVIYCDNEVMNTLSKSKQLLIDVCYTKNIKFDTQNKINSQLTKNENEYFAKVNTINRT